MQDAVEAVVGVEGVVLNGKNFIPLKELQKLGTLLPHRSDYLPQMLALCDSLA